MSYVLMVILAAGIVAADQITKFLTVAHIPLHGTVEVLPGIVRLTYVQNDGAAFSMFEGQQWLFALIFVAFAAAIIWEFSKKRLPFTTFDRFCIVAVFAGGLGNMIDRLRMGYVVDMIATEFINFPVFNVADCFITCGCIILLVHLIFFNKDFWKEDKS
ncbi:MAG: signal peptidase II [Oscillospiraceae bacterium]|nr:signal peptidase II [Oscillospiraceae bacterium]